MSTRDGHPPGNIQERTARVACFEVCSMGGFLDPENGCVSKCASPAECQSWRAMLATRASAPSED